MIMKQAPRHITPLFLLLLAIALHGCSKKQTADFVFETLSSDSTGIRFANQLKPTPDFNLFSYMYYYNGAGVGAGDVNNECLTDLFFASNQHQNALYLNKGQMHFEDITEAAGIPKDSSWSTGVSMVDINADGSPEIYVYVTSAGSGSYGSLVAYSANRRKSLSEIYLPPIAEQGSF